MSGHPSSVQQGLPRGFEALEPFMAQWCCETSAERMEVRCEADMGDIRSFYDSMLEHADAAFDLIERYPIGEMPDDVARLAKLLLGLAQASVAVEIHGQPRAPDTPYPNSIKLIRSTAPFG